jgi:hypothetical protein
VGPVRACSSHFHEMVILRLLFLGKLATTLVKGAHPCKVSRLDFLNSQSKTLYRSPHGQTSPRGQISQFGQHKQCSIRCTKHS